MNRTPYWGIGIARGQINRYQPYAGLMNTRDEAERAVGALK
jgi:hypothetical protein